MEVKKSLKYGFDPDKYFAGIGEEFEGSLDDGADPEITIDLAASLGAKSMRIWMHHRRLLTLGANGLEWKENALRRYHGYVDEIVRRGMRVVAMNHHYVQPRGCGCTPDTMEIPLPGTRAYFDQMNIIEQAYAMIAKEFPGIGYFECGNEVNMNFYLPKPCACEKPIKNDEYDSDRYYTNVEKAEITADICYYSTLGVRKGNPDAFVVFPALTPYRGYAEAAEFMEYNYRAIESGKFPRGLKSDTNPDNYFQVHCWHAYNFGGDSSIIERGGKMLRTVMDRHGDAGKKIFITEFGYTDYDFMKVRGMTKEQADETTAGFLENDFKAFRAIGGVETVFIFRLYDWLRGPGMETGFGLFTSPASDTGIAPKRRVLEIFRLFNGEGADAKMLYRYAKNEKNLS